MIYLDNAATTLQKPQQIARAVTRAMERYASPGRGGYTAAMDAAKAVYRCRELAAILFEAEPEQVVFTMNATHALNLAIKTVVQPEDTVVVSGFEHNAVMRPLFALNAHITVAGRKLFAPEDTLREFDNAITLRTKAVICTHVSNVFGYRLPIEEIAALCAKRNVPFIVDASQSAGTLPVSMKRLGAAFIAMPGHKGLYGPQGTGILLCGRLPTPLLEGGTGSQSRLYAMPKETPDAGEAGTHNVPGICGLAEGIQFVCRKTPEGILRHEQSLMEVLKPALQSMPHIQTFLSDDVRQVGVLSFNVTDLDCEEAAQRLSDRGIAVRAGLHCAPLAHESAGTLDSGTIRISLSAFNSLEEITKAVRILQTLGNCATAKMLGV